MEEADALQNHSQRTVSLIMSMVMMMIMMMRMMVVVMVPFSRSSFGQLIAGLALLAGFPSPSPLLDRLASQV